MIKNYFPIEYSSYPINKQCMCIIKKEDELFDQEVLKLVLFQLIEERGTC